jgi:hypothetical protein
MAQLLESPKTFQVGTTSREVLKPSKMAQLLEKSKFKPIILSVVDLKYVLVVSFLPPKIRDD